jgi:alcohol dehydrogenase
VSDLKINFIHIYYTQYINFCLICQITIIKNAHFIVIYKKRSVSCYFKNFSYAIPGEVAFGVGAISQLPEKLKKENADRVLILSDRGLEKAGLVAKIEDILKKEGIFCASFLDVEPNSSVETVEAAAKVFTDNNLNCILCLGGGSPIDTGKAVSVLAANGGNLTDYEGVDKFTKPLPLLAVIPTTAGTGSEATAFAIINDKKRKIKFAIVSNKLIPKLTILDPNLITTLPPYIAATTGMDALTHAIESYLSVTASTFTDAMGLKAMELIGRYLRRFVANRTDIEAASAMLLASNFAGIAFSWGRLGAAHALAHPLGAYWGIAARFSKCCCSPART